MPKARQRPNPDGTVLVVCSNAETREGLEDYFGQTGIAVTSRHTINPLAELSSSLRAMVMFPDDFPPHQASAYLSMARARHPDLTVVIVTKEPPVYTGMTATNGRPLNAIVLPRPVFGWTILDAIRAERQVESND